jgi:hypothetical protein
MLEIAKVAEPHIDTSFLEQTLKRNRDAFAQAIAVVTDRLVSRVKGSKETVGYSR